MNKSTAQSEVADHLELRCLESCSSIFISVTCLLFMKHLICQARWMSKTYFDANSVNVEPLNCCSIIVLLTISQLPEIRQGGIDGEWCGVWWASWSGVYYPTGNLNFNGN